jgi:hypothetical protein
LKLGADVQVTKNDSSYQDQVRLVGATSVYPTSAGVTAVPLADIHNKLERLAVFAEYMIDKNSDLRFDLVHERWRTDDWSWQFADGAAFQYGTTIDQTNVIANRNQSTNFVGLRYILRFR